MTDYRKEWENKSGEKIRITQMDLSGKLVEKDYRNYVEHLETLLAERDAKIEGKNDSIYLMGRTINNLKDKYEELKAERVCPKEKCTYWITKDPNARQKNACMNISCIRHRESEDYFQPKNEEKK